MKPSGIQTDGAMLVHMGGVAVCVLLLIAAWFFGLAPLLSDNHASATGVQRADATELEATQATQSLHELSNRLEDLQAELDDQPIGLQSASRINPLLAELAQWSEEQRLSITRTNARRPVQLTYYDYVPIELAGEGGFGALIGLLDRLKKDRADLGVVAFQIARMQGGNEVAFQLDLAWYVLNDEGIRAIESTATAPTP